MIDNTTNDIPLPSDIQTAIIAARNNVSVLEAKAQRMERLIGSQKRELSSLGGALADINKQTDTITERRVALTKEVASLEKSKTSLLADILEMEKRNAETRAEIDTREQQVRERESSLALAEEAQQRGYLALTERVAELDREEKALTLKKTAISELLSKL